MRSKITTTIATTTLHCVDSMLQAYGKTLKHPQSYQIPSLLKGSHTLARQPAGRTGNVVQSTQQQRQDKVQM